MNIIKTVGDLKKALSVYEDHLPIEVKLGKDILYLTTDYQLRRVTEPDREYFEICVERN